MPPQEPNTDLLLAQASQGDVNARNQLLDRHRSRLRSLIALRMDRRLTARFDPSDVVQESLAVANNKLSDYLRTRPLPFYVWLRQLALERLVDLHRLHIRAQKRSVRRETGPLSLLPDDSMEQLAGRLVAHGSSPSEGIQQVELQRKLRSVLDQLGERDREVLVLRHLEQLSTAEIASALGITEGAVKVRHVRALQRLRELLGDSLSEELP